jgi:hypothetical protein
MDFGHCNRHHGLHKVPTIDTVLLGRSRTAALHLISQAVKLFPRMASQTRLRRGAAVPTAAAVGDGCQWQAMITGKICMIWHEIIGRGAYRPGAVH